MSVVYYDFKFRSKCSITVLPGLPGEGPSPFQFHDVGESSFREGIAIRVDPVESSSWVGNFQRGVGGISAVFHTFLEDQIGVVAEGRGYLVSIHQPSRYSIIESVDPIMWVGAIEALDVLLIGDPTRIHCFGKEGLKWRSECISTYSYRVSSVSERRITGTGVDLPNNALVEFAIDPRNGSTRGGVSRSPSCVDDSE